MIDVPGDKKGKIRLANELIEQCNVSQGKRASHARMIHMIVETGRQDGTRSSINLMQNHVDRVASHFFSPVDLQFTIDFENNYDKNTLERAKVAARILTREWERTNTDMVFGRGVFEATKYGACLLKQFVQMEGVDEHPVHYKYLVLPWNFGVYREDENEISKQPALCETIFLSMPEVWRRIHHLPEANMLYKRIESHAQRGSTTDDPSSFMHQVLSTSMLNTTGIAGPPKPGGIVALGQDPVQGVMGPETDIDLVKMHEIWVQDEDDYTTIQIIEPDVLIAPLYKKANLLISGVQSGLQPYSMIQPNEISGYFWGRSEITDLIEPQTTLSSLARDGDRLMALQVEKILSFQGWEGLTDEIYGQRLSAGYFNPPPGATVTDLTPKFPPELVPMIKMWMDLINTIGGFPEIMQGKGEQGVRAGVHANTLLKTGSPRLRDRSLLIERQCATAADLTLSIKEAKDANNYWTHGDTLETIENSQFLLSDLPEDRRVAVDSHSSSPIFADDHAQLVSFGVKAGFISGDDAIDLLNFPQKELLHLHFKEREAAKQKLMQDHPELLEAMVKGGHHGGHK